jgi:hypothetical protein
MARRFHPRVLFEKWRPDPRRRVPYPTFTSELDAIRDGRKPMSLFSASLESMLSDESLELYRHAFARGLVVVWQRERTESAALDRQTATAFVARPEELWRIPAYLAMWQAADETGGWSDAAEAQQGLLLGYSSHQRAAWRELLRNEYAGWGGQTIYAVLDRDGRRAVEATGRRCFGAAITGVSVHVGFGLRLKQRAWRLVPDGLSLARAVIAHDGFRAVFGDPRKMTAGVASATITRKLAPRANAALRSNVELLTRSGWR